MASSGVLWRPGTLVCIDFTPLQKAKFDRSSKVARLSVVTREPKKRGYVFCPTGLGRSALRQWLAATGKGRIAERACGRSLAGGIVLLERGPEVSSNGGGLAAAKYSRISTHPATGTEPARLGKKREKSSNWRLGGFGKLRAAREQNRETDQKSRTGPRVSEVEAEKEPRG